MNQTNATRRTFLRGTVAGAAGIAVLPSFAAPLGANGDVRVAVIGFNSRGAGHISSLLAIKGVRNGQLADVCAQVGLDVLSIRRLRIGRIPIGKGPEGAMPVLRDLGNGHCHADCGFCDSRAPIETVLPEELATDDANLAGSGAA